MALFKVYFVDTTDHYDVDDEHAVAYEQSTCVEANSIDSAVFKFYQENGSQFDVHYVAKYA
mgnify:CR=1 FL=1